MKNDILPNKNKQLIFIFFILFCLCFSSIAQAVKPSISFVPPTPATSGNQYVTYIPVNISSSYSGQHYVLNDFNREVLYWMQMDNVDGSGNPIDNSTWHNNGTKQGNAAQDASGKFGKCFIFDGNGDAFITPTSSSLNTLNDDLKFTVSFWAKCDENPSDFPNSGRGLIGFTHSNTNRIYIAISKTDNGVAVYEQVTGSSGYRPVSKSLATDYIKSWHHYVIVSTNLKYSCYLDGVLNQSITHTTNYPGITSLQENFNTTVGRGSYLASTYDWKGKIDDVIIFNRNITLGEIQSLYNASVTKFNKNFTSLQNGNYTIRAHAVGSTGDVNHTDVRWRNISIDYQPTLSSVYPVNGTYATPWPTCHISLTDLNYDTLTVTWKENSTGIWTTRQVNSGVSVPSTLSWLYSNAITVNHKYYWRVFVNDGYYNISQTFHFTVNPYNFEIRGLTNSRLTWGGLPGSTYWSNSSGAGHETMEVNVTPGIQAITGISLWMGDLSLRYNQSLINGNNVVNLPQWAIDSRPSNTVEDVFYSVLDNLQWVYASDGSNWYYARTPSENTLQTINAETDYTITVNASLILELLSNTTVRASNISIVASSDNTTWGSNRRTFVDGGSYIVFNLSSWTTGNGCYGTNIFTGGLVNKTKSIFCRFRLTLPIYMPSNHTYVSLTATNWKVDIYSNLSAGGSEPPLNAASKPPFGNFSIKWQKSLGSSIIAQAESPPVCIDVNGDGIQEIFFAGIDVNDATKCAIECINGSTGSVIWIQYFPYVGNTHYPVMVHDFDKDGTYEIIQSADYRTICRNALTGDIKWNSSVGSGWHNLGFIDYGGYTIIYTFGGWSDGTARVAKLWGNNGTLIKSVKDYGPCYGGVSIADINNDGHYEIIIGARGTDNYPGSSIYCKGLQVFDEDLTLLWNYQITCSSHCMMIADINGDGYLEIVAGKQNGIGASRIYIFKYDGTILYTSDPIFSLHLQPTIGDVDGDGHYELIDGDYGSSYYPKIFDLVTHTVEGTLTKQCYFPPSIGNVIYDPGETGDTSPEILFTPASATGDFARVYKYVGGSYQEVFVTPTKALNSVVSDVDHDGYNEWIVQGWTLICYETNVPTSIPRQNTEIPHYGFRRMSNTESYSLPSYQSNVWYQSAFGGYVDVLSLSPSVFITGVTSQHPLIEFNGEFDRGYYTSDISTNIYLPSPWTVDKLYVRLINGSTIYANFTSGFTVSTVNTSYKSYTRNWNPSSLPNNDKMKFDASVYVKLKYLGVPTYEGTRLFTNIATVYELDPPIGQTVLYDTSTNMLRIHWHKGNYSDLNVVIRKNSSRYPSSPSDGIVIQNSTALWYNATVAYTSSYCVYSYNATTHSFSEPYTPIWGALGITVKDENKTSESIYFDLLISNKEGTSVYTKSHIKGPYYIDIRDLPYGDKTIFIISNSSFKQRTYYEDLSINTFYNFIFYLPPVTVGGGTTQEENRTQLYLLTVYNRYAQMLQDVKIDVRRYINATDSYESVGIIYTDAAGQADIFLISYKLYQFVLSKNGFQSTTSYWTPTTLIQTHTFIMDYEISIENQTIDPYSVITFTAGFSTNNITLTIDVDDSTNNLTDATIYIYENTLLIYSIDFSSTPYHLDYVNNVTSPNNNLSEYVVVLAIRNHSEFPNNGNYNFTIIIQKSNPHGLLLNLDLDLTGILGDPGSGIGAHVGWINIFICGLGVFVIVSFGRYWAGIGIIAMGFIVGLIEFAFGIPGFTGIQLVSFIAYCIIMGALVEIGKAKQGRVGY